MSTKSATATSSSLKHDTTVKDEDGLTETDNAINKKWEQRAAKLAETRTKLRSGWRNDPAMLDQYFQSCLANWKLYRGDRTQTQVMKLHGYYKQAVFGDSTEAPPDNPKSTDFVKWNIYMQLKGTPKEMAKRRFITYLAEINPVLIDVMPDEKPPSGFPHDKDGRRICAKCNTLVGCTRPILDENKVDIRSQLFESEELHEPNNLRQWVKNATTQQRCVWGMHMAINPFQAKPFHAWFNRPENGGYSAFDSSSIMEIVHELLLYHYELAYDMQENQKEYTPEAFNFQAIKANKIKDIYEVLSGTKFIFEAPCKSVSDLCIRRRLADGGKNHTHAVEIDPPTKADQGSYEESIELREQCRQLGLDQHTGVVDSVHTRCEIYKKRISDYFEALKASMESKERNEQRADIHAKQKKAVFKLSADMLQRQCWDNCNANKPDQVLQLVKRGCDVNEESPRGITPLLCFVLNDTPAEYVDELIMKRVNLNQVNKHGITALTLACKLRMTKMIHVLMRAGAAATQGSGKLGKNRTALHWCASQSCEEEAQIIYNYVKDGGGDALRLSKLLDAKDEDGDSPLIIAARSRNGLMCKILTSMGASPNVRNNLNRNAAFVARDEGWTELADWLEKKIGAGVAKLETFSDMQFDKQVRYASMKLKEQIGNFQKSFFQLTFGVTTSSPLGSPTIARRLIIDEGSKMKSMQQCMVDKYHYYILKIDEYGVAVSTKDHDTVEANEHMLDMRSNLSDMIGIMRSGGNPNTESVLKPMALTPLMCAVIMNDLKLVRLMMREGSDANYVNRNGMNAIMLAAQLNNVYALLELLDLKGDLSIPDNEGYTALAYATSLPAPQCRLIEGVSYLMDGDNGSHYLLSSEQVLKSILSLGKSRVLNTDAIREALQRNVEENKQVDTDVLVLRLLEQYGLTRIETDKQLLQLHKTAMWRVHMPGLGERRMREDDSDSETASEEERRTRKERLYAAKEAMRVAKELEEQRETRCPICTLMVPCAHFAKPALLQKFLKNNNMATQKVSTEGMTAADKAILQMSKIKRMKVKDKNQSILDEAHIGDRHTDRSLILWKQHRPRERAVQKEMLLVEQERQAHEEERKELQESLDDGTYTPWKEMHTDDGQRILKNRESGDVWEVHVDDYGKAYYYNNDTNVSRWDTPENDVSPPVMEQMMVESSNAAVVAPTGTEEGPNKSSKKAKVKEDAAGTQAQDSQRKVSDNNVKQKGGVVNPFALVVNNVRETVMNVRSILKQPYGEGDEPRKKQSKRVKFVMDDEGSSTDIADAHSDDDADGSVTTHAVASDATTEEEREKTVKDTNRQKTLSSAISVLSSGGASRVNKYGLNPIPVERRRIMLWTSERIDRGGKTDGLILDYSNSIAKNNSKYRKRETYQLVMPTVQVAGWVFVPLSSAINKPPDAMKLSMDAWGLILEEMRVKLINDWIPSMVLGTVVNVKSWKSAVPRCSICQIGFARLVNSVSDSHLCLCCVVRRDLHERAVQALPRSERMKLSSSADTLSWPFMHNDPAVNASVAQNIPPSSLPLSSPQPLIAGGSRDAFDTPDRQLSAATLPMSPMVVRLKSPISSTRLDSIDAMEESMKRLSGNESSDWVNMMDSSSVNSDNRDFNSLGLDSSLSISSAGTGIFDGSSYFTQESDHCRDQGKYGILELSLLPFLIAKGLFQDAERMVRASLNNASVNEGEGIVTVIKLLGLQAEIYKQMGLWPLALGLYLDCADLTSVLLGFDDNLTVNAICMTAMCLRKMHQPTYAREYLSQICEKLTRTVDTKKKAMALTIADSDKFYIRELVNAETIWSNDINKLTPTTELKKREFNIYGLGGLFHLLTSIQGHYIAARVAFLHYCDGIKENAIHKHVSYVIACFRVRLCDNSEVYRHLVQQLVQKQVSKSLVKVSVVADLFHQVAATADKNALTSFLEHGIPVKINVFDRLLLHSLQLILPVYVSFLSGGGGQYIRDHCIDLNAEELDIKVVRIQSFLRGRVVFKRHAAIKETNRKKRENEMKRAKFLKSASPSKVS